MKKLFIVLVTFVPFFSFSGCANRWKNMNTGAERSGVPNYEACAKDVSYARTDSGCYVTCMNALEKQYGKTTYAMSSACTQKCEYTESGKAYDNHCNEAQAKRDGWMPMK